MPVLADQTTTDDDRDNAITTTIMIITMITVLHGIYPPSSYWELEACEKLFEFLHTRKWLYGGSCYKSSTRHLGASIKWGVIPHGPKTQARELRVHLGVKCTTE